jgi:hypothetical protein
VTDSTEWPQTVWRIVGLTAESEELNVRLVVDTTEPAIVDAIERGARQAGVELERVEET